jgi:hypothetical protein
MMNILKYENKFDAFLSQNYGNFHLKVGELNNLSKFVRIYVIQHAFFNFII